MLSQIAQLENCALYKVEPKTPSKVHCFIASTPESRSICNDPTVVGIEYTEKLRNACASVLSVLRDSSPIAKLEESEATVLHILRGGLNFGLREALGQAYGWNRHVSAFLSAQRKRQVENPEQWEIGERDYKKVYLPQTASIVFGDVVATGTSLQYAMDCLIEHLEASSSSLRSVVFFTIGGVRTEEILAKLDSYCRSQFPQYESTAVVYLEGRFVVADNDTPVRIKFTGTDLLRAGSLMAPEFVESQKEYPSYALERCTIYDAGSRAFWLPEYEEDVVDYWKQSLALAKQGVTYAELLSERYPEHDSSQLVDVDLVKLCEAQIAKFN